MSTQRLDFTYFKGEKPVNRTFNQPLPLLLHLHVLHIDLLLRY